MMPEWSKGYDLRSYGESLVGSNPTPSNKCSHSSVGQSVGLMSRRSAVQARLGAYALVV